MTSHVINKQTSKNSVILDFPLLGKISAKHIFNNKTAYK